jgi:hypothetical protein
VAQSRQAFEGFMGTHKSGLEAVMAAQPLSGPKVGGFHAAMMGDPNGVAVDRWVARAIGYGDKLTEQQNRFIDYAISQVARARGLEPRQLQAAIWRAMKENSETGAFGYDPREEFVTSKLKARYGARKIDKRGSFAGKGSGINRRRCAFTGE